MVYKSSSDPQSKLKSLNELREAIAAARQDGKTVVFANGCFDLIHVGHIRYLESARSQGDVLIVAINGDDSVSLLKGDGRPLQAASERAEILGSFDCVDYTLVFDSPTVDGILLELQPDIHAKGTDYTHDSIPERETVRSYGGKTAITGDPKSHSSRDMIESILTKYRS